MSGIACTDVAMGWIGGVLYSRVARTRSCFRGSKGRLVYVGWGPAYVVWSGIPSWVFNRFESSLPLGYGDSLLCSSS